MKVRKFLSAIGFAGLAFCVTSCSPDDEPPIILDGPEGAEGLFVVCEGNWGYGNSSVSFIDTDNYTVANEVFQRANGQKLGDTAESMTIHDDMAWIVVNTSGVVFAVDKDTYVERGRVENLVSPRFIHFVSDDKAYLTDMYSNEVLIIDPKTYSVSGRIAINSPAEEIVQDGRYVYVNCWSYGREIVKIDTVTDQVVATLNVGIQPRSIALDGEGDLWALCDGGSWEGNPVGYVAPTLVRVDLDTFTATKTFTFTLGDNVSRLVTDATGHNLYWLNNGVYKMSIDASAAPSAPFIERDGTTYYALTVSPDNGDIFIGDAVDYMQNGAVYRYDATGTYKDSFTVGVLPSNFCWKN